MSNKVLFLSTLATVNCFQHKHDHSKKQPKVSVSFDGQDVEFTGARVEGRDGNKVDAFFGVRYGAEPERWHDSELFSNWNATQDFSDPTFEQCTQKLIPNDGLLGEQPYMVGSDDCLKMNIWTPPNAKKGDKLAVMAYIHGGAFQEGGIQVNDPNGLFGGIFYQGQNLVENTIVVTFQYRLGYFGFLGSDKMRSLTANNSTGNFGTGDQRLALQWIHEHIEDFGGDKDRVMLFGESSGAGSVSHHAISKLSWPYFQRAAMESGAFSEFLLQDMDNANSVFDTIANKYCSDVVNSTDAAIVDCMMNIPNDIVVGLNDDPSLNLGSIAPAIDGVVMTCDFNTCLTSDPPVVNDVPYIMGSNANDGIFMASQGGIMGGINHPPEITDLARVSNTACVGENINKTYPVTNISTGEEEELSLLDVCAFDNLDQTTPPMKKSDILNDWYWTSGCIQGASYFMCSAIDGAQELTFAANHTSPVFVYEYLANPGLGSAMLGFAEVDEETKTVSNLAGSSGAIHGTDLLSVFSSSEALWDMLASPKENFSDTIFAPPGEFGTKKQIDGLAKKMSAAWIHFAKEGEPGNGWEQWDNENPTKAAWDYNLKDEDMTRPAEKAVMQCAVTQQANTCTWQEKGSGQFSR